MNNFKFKLKKGPINIKESRKYKISGKKENILSKTGTDQNWIGTICEKKLGKSNEYKWKIKILNTKYKIIMIGVAPIDFDINSSDYFNCGWYYYCGDSNLNSGPPHNYNNKI